VIFTCHDESFAAEVGEYAVVEASPIQAS